MRHSLIYLPDPYPKLMTATILKKTALTLALAALSAWQPLFAQEKAKSEAETEQAAPPANIHRIWAVTPKPDAGEAFMEALLAHMQWRLDHQDPWEWQVYVAGSGEVDGTVFLRSDGQTHAAMDAYSESEFSEAAGKHWEENVHPMVADYSTHLSRSDLALSDWPDEEYRIYTVTRFHLKPGHGAAFRASLIGIDAKLKEAGRTVPHGWNWAMTGDHLPTISLVQARKDWKGFDLPEESVTDILTEAYGPAQAISMLDSLYSHVERISSDIYFRIRDFSAE